MSSELAKLAKDCCELDGTLPPQHGKMMKQVKRDYCINNLILPRSFMIIAAIALFFPLFRLSPLRLFFMFMHYPYFDSGIIISIVNPEISTADAFSDGKVIRLFATHRAFAAVKRHLAYHGIGSWCDLVRGEI